MSSNSPTTPDNCDPVLVDILEASTAAAEKFQAENAAIDRAHNAGKLRGWLEEKYPDEYGNDGNDGEDALAGGSGLGGETLAESPAGP